MEAVLVIDPLRIALKKIFINPRQGQFFGAIPDSGL